MSTTELVEKIDATFGLLWNIYRTEAREWIVMPAGGRDGFRGETIEDALSKAAAYVPLPVIPRDPGPAARYGVRKDGSKWCVTRNDRSHCGNIATKRKATEVAERFHEHEVERYRSWVQEHLHYVETHTEGVDFRWAD